MAKAGGRQLVGQRLAAAPVGFLAGTTYPARAVAYLMVRPRLWQYVAAPIAVNIVLALGLYVVLLRIGLEIITGMTATWPASLGFVADLLFGLLVVALLIVIGFIFVRFGVVIGSPWYTRLSERLEREIVGEAPREASRGIAWIARDLGRAVAFELKKLLLVAGIAGPLIAVNLVPGIGQVISSVGWVLLGVVIANLDFLDPPLERRRFGFRRRIGVIRRCLPGSAGFGVACAALVSIPFVNLVAIPICIAAGTLYFCDQVRPRLAALSPPTAERPRVGDVDSL